MISQDKINHLITELQDIQSRLGKTEIAYTQALIELNRQLELANGIISDFILETQHMPNCRFDSDSPDWNRCKCMDRNHFNPDANIQRAKDYQIKYGLEDS